jgi:hypothetical protein
VAVVLAERYADGEASAAELSAVSAAIAPNLPSADRVAIKAKAAALYGTDPYIRRHPLFFGGASVDTEVADRDDGITTPSENELAFKAAEASEATLLRCLFGNPFRPCTFAEAWRTDTVLSLARTMYDSRDFGAMPILADAIQDAECDNDIILDHCRGPRPHCRGCWVVDLILGKE